MQFNRELSAINDAFDVDTSPTEIFTKLSNLVEYIWKHGLTEDDFIKLVIIFIKKDDLNISQRTLILECLIPQFVIEGELVRDLLVWFFSMYNEDPQAASCFLSWMADLLHYKLMDHEVLESFYGQLVTCFQSEHLVKSLCNVLMHLTNEKTINKRIIFLLQEFQSQFKSPFLNNLLWKIKQFSPNDVTAECSYQCINNEKESNFCKAVMKIARKQGISFPTFDQDKLSNLIKPGKLPTSEYDEENSGNALTKLTNMFSAVDLGRAVGDQSLITPENPISLVGSKMGLIYLQSFGPNKEFLNGLECVLKSQPSDLVLSKLCETQIRLRHGLPIITKYLAIHLLTWDGVTSQTLVFDFIRWIHFDSFAELTSVILVPLTRLYVCTDIETKVKILNAMADLLLNMVSVHMERLQTELSKFDYIERAEWLDNPMETFKRLCDYVNALIETGLSLEGMECSSIILQAVKFYNLIITLQLEYKLFCIVPPSSAVMYASLLNMNHIVLSEVGSLLIRYKKELLPWLDSLNTSLEEFEEDINQIHEISENIFNYLWLGKELAGSDANSLEEANHSCERTKKHPGIFLLIEFLSKETRMNLKKLDKEKVLLMLESCSEGIGQFLRYHINNAAAPDEFYA